MDPNETLREIRKLVARGKKRSLLARDIDDLDDWLSRGGFLPDAWKGES